MQTDTSAPHQENDPLDNFFSPMSVAIVGASSKPGKIGHELVRNISKYQYRGRVYPINPSAEEILGLKCYPSISLVKERIDLAVFVAPSNILPQLAEEAGEQGVRNAIVVSGGFREMGEEKAAYQDQLVSVARRYRMRVIGPNCIGVFDSESRLDTFFYPHDRMTRPKPGGVSFITQSGTFGLTFLEWATSSSLGIRRLVSLGNRCDVDEVELVRYLGRDPLTRVIALHLESFSDGRSLVREAKDVSARKPIVILKTGRVEGSRAAMSHTGAVTGPYKVCRSILRRSGMIVAESFEHLFDISKAIEKQPAARGGSVSIVTNAAGPSVAAADLCHERGLMLGRYTVETLDKLRSSLPPYAVIGEYVDLTGSATSEDYEKTLKAVLRDPNVDVLLNFVVFLNPPLSTDVVRVIAEAQGFGRPIVNWATGGEFTQGLIRRLEEEGVPTYPTSERLVNAALGLVEAGMKRGWGSPPEIAADRKLAGEVIGKALSEGRHILSEVESKDLLRAYGIKTTTEYIATTAAEACMYATKLGYPVVLKALSPQVTHKSDVGGVITNLKRPEEVSEAYEEIILNVRSRKPGATVQGVVVENQLPPGLEFIIGAVRDRDFGPTVAFGLGGIFVEALEDLSYGLAPVSEEEALDIISSTKASRLLQGVRGGASIDRVKLADLLVRASILSFEQPIAEMDLNPVIASGSECAVADARVRISD
ncbi:acetate--CoA ligase family protein [Candidatus Bathyarchaeota archaeon]|nr:acetate--CoA ligase family protein [Candidatus Bathyarchaeota archaeon]